MVQEFHVIRCFSCETFQVHQVKKTNKWNCKLCGEKQSVRKEYGRGSGADCRRHVQKLNMMRATVDPTTPAHYDMEDGAEEDWQGDAEDATSPQHSFSDTDQRQSKWGKFVSSSDQPEDTRDPSDTEDTQFTTDKNTFQQRKRKGKRQGGRNQSCYRQGKRQRCHQGAVPDESARPSPVHETESPPVVQRGRGYSSMQGLHSQSTGGVTRHTQHQDFTCSKTGMQTTAQTGWKQSETANFPQSGDLSESFGITEDKQSWTEDSWKEIAASNCTSVDREKRPWFEGGQKQPRSMPSSSMSSSRWSKFTSKHTDLDDDIDKQTTDIENFDQNIAVGPNSYGRYMSPGKDTCPNISSVLHTIPSSDSTSTSVQYNNYDELDVIAKTQATEAFHNGKQALRQPANQDYPETGEKTWTEACSQRNQIGKTMVERGFGGSTTQQTVVVSNVGSSIKESSSCHANDSAHPGYSNPTLEMSCISPGDVICFSLKTSNEQEVANVRKADFSTGEDLDDVLSGDIWDL